MLARHLDGPRRHRIALRMGVEIGLPEPAADEWHDAIRDHHMRLAPRELALHHDPAYDRRERHAADRRKTPGAELRDAMPPAARIPDREIGPGRGEAHADARNDQFGIPTKQAESLLGAGILRHQHQSAGEYRNTESQFFHFDPQGHAKQRDPP